MTTATIPAPLPAAAITPADLEVANTIFASLAPATREIYRAHTERFSAWCRAHGGDLDGHTLAAHLRHLHETGLSPATIRQAAAAVRKLAVALDREISGRDKLLVTAAIQHATREGRDRGRGSAASAGWSAADAASRLASATGTVQGLRDAALVRVTSDALLRVGEVSALDVRDLEYRDDGSARVHIRFSKTDQSGEGATLYLGPATRTSIERYLAVASHTGGALWRATRGPRVGRRMSAPAVRCAITRWLRLAGVRGRVSGHSLRRGSAAALVRRGASTAQVAQAGRWSDARQVQRYAAGELARRGAVARLRYAQ